MSTAKDGGLPDGVELAWGLRERPGKGPRRTLTLSAIVEAGIRVGAAEGLAAVSMSRVASEVGVSTMALYRYVAAKDDLLALMMDEAFGPPPDLPGPEVGWRTALTGWAWAMRAALRRHPWVLRAPITGPPVMPNTVAWAEAGLRGMRGTALDGGAKISLLLLLSNYVRSEVALFHDLNTALAEAATTEQEMLVGYGDLLAKLTDRQRFPELTALLDEGVFEAGDDPDADFVFGLERLLDGIECLIRPQS